MSNMNSATIVDKLMESATQLLVADRLKAPKDAARQPLSKTEARAYVIDAAMIFGEAHRFVEEVEADLTNKKKKP